MATIAELDFDLILHDNGFDDQIDELTKKAHQFNMEMSEMLGAKSGGSVAGLGKKVAELADIRRQINETVQAIGILQNRMQNLYASSPNGANMFIMGDTQNKIDDLNRKLEVLAQREREIAGDGGVAAALDNITDSIHEQSIESLQLADALRRQAEEADRLEKAERAQRKADQTAKIQAEREARKQLVEAKKKELEWQKKIDAQFAVSNDAMKKAKQNVDAFQKSQAGLNTQLDRGSRLMRGLTSLAATYFSVAGAERLVRNLVQVTGEFEMQRTTLRAILKDVDAADTIFSQIKELAVISPFTFKELVTYTKQLSAFSVPMNELYDTTKMLADVSAGLGVGMDRLILAYGQIRSAGVLRGQELRQLTEAGVPVLYELKKAFQDLGETAITTSDIFDKISTRQVPFEMIANIFKEMTSEGGKFYKMQEVQAATLQGKLSNLTDAYQIMFSEIGERLNPAMKAGVDWLKSLAENYESVGRKIGNLITIYGTYRVALTAIHALQKITTFETGLNAIIANANAAGQAITRLRAAVQALTTAQAANNAVSAANVYAAIAAAVAMVVIGIASLIRKLREQDAVTKSMTKATETYNQTLHEESAELQLLFNRLKNAKEGTVEYDKAKKDILNTYDKYLDDVDRENLLLGNQAAVYASLTQKIRENAAMKAYSVGMEGISDTFLNQQTDIITALTKKIKKKVGEADYEIVATQLGKLVRGEINEADLSDVVSKYLTSWRAEIQRQGGAFTVDVPYVDNAAKAYKAASDALEQSSIALSSQLNIIYGVDFSKQTDQMADWQKAIEGVLKEYGNLGLQLKTDDFSTQEAYLDAMMKKYNEAESTIKKFGKTENAETKAAKQLIPIIERLFSTLNVDMKTWGSTAGAGRGGATSDPMVQMIEQRIRKLQDFQEMYKNLSSFMSNDAIKQAFGSIFTEGFDFDTLIENELKAMDQLGDQGAKKAAEIRAAMSLAKAKKEMEDMMRFQERIAGYVKEQRTIEQQIADLNDQKEQDLAKLTKGTEEYAAAEAHYNEEIAKLQERLLEIRSIQMTDFWAELTGADSDYNYKRLERLYDRLVEIQTVVKQLEPIKNDKGLIIGYRLEKTAGMSEDLAKTLGLNDENDVITLTISQFQQLQKAIGETGDKLRDSDAIRTFFKLLKEGTKDMDALRAAFHGVVEGAKTVVLGIGEVADTLSELGESTNNDMLESFGEILSMVTKIGDELMENKSFVDAIFGTITGNADAVKDIYKTTDLITLAVKGVVFVVDNIAKSFKKNYEAAQMAKKAVEEYRNALNDLQRGMFDSILGSDNLGLLGKNFQIASEAAERLRKTLSDAGFGAGFSKWHNSWFSGNVGNFDDLVYNFDLLTEQGTLNFKKLAAYADIIKNNDFINPKVKKSIDDILKAYDEWLEANEELKESYKDLFHDLSGDIVDDLLDNFDEIGDAVGGLEDMFENLGTVILRSLLNTMIINKVIKEYEDKFTDTMMKYVTGESSPEQLAAELGSIAGSIKDKTETLGDAINSAINAFVDNGLYSVAEGSNEKTLGNGIKSITEDTANLLASYINAIRADVSYSRMTIDRIANDLDLLVNNPAIPTLAEYLTQIQANTYNNAVAAETILLRLDSAMSAYPNGGRAFNVNIS